jgi:hypothetical protein
MLAKQQLETATEERRCSFQLLPREVWLVQKKEFSVTSYMCEMYTWWKAKHIHKNKLIFSPERMLHKEYYRKGSVKKSLIVDLKGLDARKKLLTINRQS